MACSTNSAIHSRRAAANPSQRASCQSTTSGTSKPLHQRAPATGRAEADAGPERHIEVDPVGAVPTGQLPQLGQDELAIGGVIDTAHPEAFGVASAGGRDPVGGVPERRRSSPRGYVASTNQQMRCNSKSRYEGHALARFQDPGQQVVTPLRNSSSCCAAVRSKSVAVRPALSTKMVRAAVDWSTL